MFIFNKSSTPSSVEVNQILNLQKEGYLIKAYEECKKLINKHPQSELLYNIAGVIKSDKKEFDKALLSYLFALRINPNYAQVYNNLGVLLKKLGEYNTSILSYIRAINLKPNYLEALNSLGNTLYKMENLKEAEIYFKKIIKLKPNFEPALLSLGQIEFNNRNYKKAIYYFDLCNTKETRSRALIALYKINEIDEIFERIKKFSNQDEKNLTISAFSSFIENITNKETANNFCKKPLDFLYYSNIFF